MFEGEIYGTRKDSSYTTLLHQSILQSLACLDILVSWPSFLINFHSASLKFRCDFKARKTRTYALATSSSTAFQDQFMLHLASFPVSAESELQPTNRETNPTRPYTGGSHGLFVGLVCLLV